MQQCGPCGSTLTPGATACPTCGMSVSMEVAPSVVELSPADETVAIVPEDIVFEAPPEPAGPVLEPIEVMEPLELESDEPTGAAEPMADTGPADRWYPVLEQNPVFSGDTTGAPVLQPVLEPIGSSGPLILEVAMDPRFEVDSAPQDGDPVVNLLLTMTPNGEPLVDPETTPIAHVIVALDLSASMNHPDKYPVLTQAIEGMLFDLAAPGDGEVLLSIVLFAYGAEVLFKAIPASTIEPRDVLTAIDRSELRFGRYTDIVGALSRAGRIALDSHQEHRATPIRIYLLTDGKPQDMDGARKVMKRVSKLPVDVDALAFGSDAHVGLLQELVSGGRGGTVKHVRKETLGEAFGRIAEVSKQVVAKRSILCVDLKGGVVGGSAYRFRPGRHAYGDQAFRMGRTFKTDLGALEAARSYSMMFQLRLPETTASESRIGEVSLLVPGFGGPQEFVCELSLPRHPGTELPESDPTVEEARNILEAMDSDDPVATLKALRTRKKLYESEHRDPYLIGLIEKAIAELEEQGSLKALSAEEQATLRAHTCTVGSGAAPTKRDREEFPFT